MPLTTYRLYGLRLDSALAFPELPHAHGERHAADVHLQTGSAEWSTWDGELAALRVACGAPRRATTVDEEADDWFGVAPDSSGMVAWFDWPGVARVRMDGGHTIDVGAHAGVDAAGLRSAILGPVFTVLLAQRGLYPMHASSVVMNGAAIAFAAVSGTGKSTLALTLAEHGYDFLSDDVTAIGIGDDPISAVPAYPQVKMLPDLIEHRGDDALAMPLVNPLEDKRARRIVVPDRQTSLPLGRIYLVEDGEPEVIGPLPIQEAFFEVLRHGHRPSLLRRVIGQEQVMERCSKVVAAVPLYRLRRPRGLDRLDELVRRVEAHAGA